MDHRVAYKPLGMSATKLLNDDDDDLEEDPDDDDEELDFQARGLGEPPLRRLGNSLKTIVSSHQCGLRQLRVALYVVAILLFLIFVAQLSTNERASRLSPSTASSRVALRDPAPTPELSPKQPEPEPLVGPGSHPRNEAATTFSHSTISSGQVRLPSWSIDARRPQYESYIASILHDPAPRLQARDPSLIMDDFLVPPVEYEHSNTNRAQWWTIGSRDAQKYTTATNYIRAVKSFSRNSSITLTTQATTEFLYHTLELCKRWDGPISVAVFCPGPELVVAVSLVKFMRNCLPVPLSACIRDKVSWHLVYNRATAGQLNFPRLHLDAKNFPLFVNQNQCPKLVGPDASDAIRQFERQLLMANKLWPESYRKQKQLPYPINVLRNTARLAAQTKYVLASDIELYPSVRLVPAFERFLTSHDIHKEHPNVQRYVFTLPIFEVKANVSAPKTKSELVQMFRSGDAIFFHKYVCDYCQNFPNRVDWLKQNQFGNSSSSIDDADELTIFEVTKRDKTRQFWEPIFIGTNEDPLYDDRLTWDGRRDKMAHMYQMCLMDYHLFVLGGAFLVHAPGIKRIDPKDVARRIDYIRSNNAIHDAIISKLKEQYQSQSGNIDTC